MRRLIFAYILAASTLVQVQVPAYAQVLAYEAFGAALDSLREQAGIPALSAAIVDDKRIVWERAYGFQDIGNLIATRTDTPFNADGLTQLFTASMAMRCTEERRLSLDDRVGDFNVETSEPDASIRQLLTHTFGPPETLSFALRPSRLAPMWPIVRACARDSYRETFANLLRRLAMFDSVPGPNIVNIRSPAEGVPDREDVERYRAVLARRALPYAVDGRGRVSNGRYPSNAASLTPASGLVTTVRDLAKFDIALRDGVLISDDTLDEAWRTPVGSAGAPLPHGIGWFVQNYHGEKVVWQFGEGDDASSSLMITLPRRGLTLIVMANSDRMVRPFSLDEGDVSRSPFARVFLNLFVR
jgi:CubicO group peptidase (beta-lactamase class C family)